MGHEGRCEFSASLFFFKMGAVDFTAWFSPSKKGVANLQRGFNFTRRALLDRHRPSKSFRKPLQVCSALPKVLERLCKFATPFLDTLKHDDFQVIWPKTKQKGMNFHATSFFKSFSYLPDEDMSVRDCFYVDSSLELRFSGSKNGDANLQRPSLKNFSWLLHKQPQTSNLNIKIRPVFQTSAFINLLFDELTEQRLAGNHFCALLTLQGGS